MFRSPKERFWTGKCIVQEAYYACRYTDYKRGKYRIKSVPYNFRLHGVKGQRTDPTTTEMSRGQAKRSTLFVRFSRASRASRISTFASIRSLCNALWLFDCVVSLCRRTFETRSPATKLNPRDGRGARTGSQVDKEARKWPERTKY